ncbi:MAG: SpoIIE family protein phosphatase [Bacteriovoracaceae bacterium]|nr:SpoIIE family protein phosphatase [Bacteriovoracaceae bacterium]
MAEALERQTQSFLFDTVNFSQTINGLIRENVEKDKIRQVFEQNKNILSFNFYRANKADYRLDVSFEKENELKLYQVAPNYLGNLKASEMENAKLAAGQSIYIQGFQNEKIPHLMLIIRDKVTDDIIISRFMLNELQMAYQQNKIYDSYLVNERGQILIGKNKNPDDKTEIVQEPHLFEIMIGKVDSGVKELVLGSVPMLLSFKKNNFFNFTVFAQIPETTAFSATQYLINKSLWFGIFILSLGIMVAIIFSRKLTKDLAKLHVATEKVAEGSFETQVEVHSRDEVGALADSFNYMGKEIVRYIGEMKEKARMENEIEVAKLVQKAFFPKDEINLNHAEIAAFYTPATECGGDWWSHIDLGDKLVLFMVDATGHGVPAALLTATANCCAQNLKTLSETTPEIVRNPESILKFMNTAVASVGGQILMTAFVAVYDYQTKKLSYANASHNPPLLYQYQDAEADKSHLVPLMDSNGERLGHNAQAQYQKAEQQLKTGDVLLLFTDGLIESTNKEGKDWGQRRFIKSFLSYAKSSARDIRSGVIKDANDFFQGQPYNDDITLVAIKIK